MSPRNGPGRPDTVGHSSVQAWSAGPLFPAVIAVIERYPASNTGNIPCMQIGGCTYCSGPSVSYQLTIGAFSEEYATREDAEMVARWACSGGRIIPDRYAQLVPGAGRSMAAMGQAYPGERCDLRAIPCVYWRGVCMHCGMPDFGGKGGTS